MANGQIYVAKKSAILRYEGRRIVVKKDVTTVRSGHPIMDGHEDLFRPLAVVYDHEAVVEDMTAEPGRKRSVGRPKLPRDDEGNIIREESSGDGAG